LTTQNLEIRRIVMTVTSAGRAPRFDGWAMLIGLWA
jgi:hypothetical protein